MIPIHSSIRIITVNQKEYIQVIVYERGARGGTRVKVLKSFGVNSKPNLIEAKFFECNYNLLVKFLIENKEFDRTLLKKIVSCRIGSILGWECIDYVFKMQ